VKKIIIENKLCAIIFNSDDLKINKGVKFLTPSNTNLQLGIMHHQTGHKILPHYHKTQKRIIHKTTELLIIKSGELQLDFYYKKIKKIKSFTLKKNTIALLIDGTHGFKVNKKCNFIEVKQGPYNKLKDKKRIKK